LSLFEDFIDFELFEDLEDLELFPPLGYSQLLLLLPLFEDLHGVQVSDAAGV
jgi:hypothetical protein